MKKKAILEFVGRLGNQIYIYCTALRLQECGYDVKFDKEYFDWWPQKRKFRWSVELDKFKVNLPWATKEEIRRYLWRTNNRYINALLKRKKYFSKKVIWIYERKDFENFPNECYLLGFEANEEFLSKNRKKLSNLFELKEEYRGGISNILDEIKKVNSVCITVRRGDLKRYSDANILPIDYYKKAVDIIKTRIKDPIFYITSDEIEWCKENFGWLDNKIFLNYKSHENFEIAKSCKHIILSNSTFSWWAAFLNQNKEAIIISPQKFYIRERDKYSNLDLFPKEWMWI